MTTLRQGYVVGDQVFDTKKEALDYLRRPKILEALKKLTGNDNEELAQWLLDNQETVSSAFDVGTIRRVTKSEHNKLSKAMEYLIELNDPKLDFLKNNADAVLESFRWPKTKRMTPEQKAVAARNTLTEASGGNEELADCVMANEEAVLEAYQAGVEKRKVNPAAAEALKQYREKMAAKKAAKEKAA